MSLCCKSFGFTTHWNPGGYFFSLSICVYACMLQCGSQETAMLTQMPPKVICVSPLTSNWKTNAYFGGQKRQKKLQKCANFFYTKSHLEVSNDQNLHFCHKLQIHSTFFLPPNDSNEQHLPRVTLQWNTSLPSGKTALVITSIYPYVVHILAADRFTLSVIA